MNTNHNFLNKEVKCSIHASDQYVFLFTLSVHCKLERQEGGSQKPKTFCGKNMHISGTTECIFVVPSICIGNDVYIASLEEIM